MRILPTLTKQYILERITDKQIFEKFLKEEVAAYTMFYSPFLYRSGETRPSASFRIDSNGSYRFSDFGSPYINLDCFSFVAVLHGLDSTDKTGFFITLNIIAKAFKLHQYSDDDDDAILDIINNVQRADDTKTIIYPILCDYTEYDLNYWKQFNIDTKILNHFRVYRAAYIFIKNRKFTEYYQIYNYKYDDPAFVYFFGVHDGRNIFEVYYPKRTKQKHMTNKAVTKGLNQLSNAKINKFIIVTKSWKDKLSLTSFLYRGEHIKSIAFSSESIAGQLTQKEIDFIKSKGYDNIYTLTDYDPAGLHIAWVHRKKYNTKPLFFKNETWNSKIKYPIKDFTDYVKIMGIDQTQNLINNLNL